MFTGALFTIARTWEQPWCPSADEWIKKVRCIYTMECYSATKRNAFESVPMRWMACYTEWSKSEREKHNSYIKAYIWNLENWYWWTYLQDRRKNEDLQNRLWTQWGKERMGCIERGAQTHIRYMSNREPVGSCCVAQELSLVLCDNREGWEAMRGSGEVQEGRDICVLVADSCCCMEEANTIL